MSCGSHTLNLVISDAAKSSAPSMSFFCSAATVSPPVWLLSYICQQTCSETCVSNQMGITVSYKLPEMMKSLGALKEYQIEK